MRKMIKKIFVWSILATFVLLLATHNPHLIASLWGDVGSPIISFLGTAFHNLIHHGPHIHVGK